MEVDFGPDEPITLELLGDDSEASICDHVTPDRVIPDRVIPARVVQVSGRTLKVKVDSPVVPGVAVRISSLRFLLLSEVMTVDKGTGLTQLTIRHVFSAVDVESIQQKWR